jgi:Cys-tRNA(Pro)/Cys-tRNA(Cys) deacylase
MPTPGGTPALVALHGAGVPHTTHAYEHDVRSTAYGEEAAAALGVDPLRLLKTLVVDVDGRLVVAVVPVAGSLDLKALAAAVGGRRAALADQRAAERATGYIRGGISPLGHRTRLPVVVDAGALAHDTVLVSAGRRGLQVELAPADLVRLAGATTAAIEKH